MKVTDKEKQLMAFIKRFSEIKKGGVIFTGNTLGLSKISNVNRAGTLGSIGAFTSLNSSLKVNDFPSGTTLNFAQNGSSADLLLPAGSDILYAELVWGGLFRSTANNISSQINNSILFTTPVQSQSISPDTVTAQTYNISVSGTTLGFYSRSQNVTNMVRLAGAGTYSVQGVPALIEALDNRTNDTNHAGWTLAVVYANQLENFRSLNLWVGGEVVSPDVGVTNIVLSGFQTPDVASPEGKLFVSSQEGDAVISGDQMLFSSDGINYSNLFGPNNPLNNFFASQINNSSGLINTSGTFGLRNSNAQTGTNISAGRQGYDITAVDLTGKLSPLQNTAYIKFTSNGDLYLPNCLAIQIENGVNPSLLVTKTVDKSFAIIGDELTYVSLVKNDGSLILFDIIFKDTIPAGSEFVEQSVLIDGIAYPSYDPSVGFLLPNIIPGGSVIVSFKVKVI